ncbi:NAD-dependent epimerase/dehydratase family protein [Staphylococcus sp. NRL 16/872]|uniref:NAD-dependent epimerase/dehydratase family protein n=1 Tax=Staphylococcus sp. NRL 16/872 TaxID=2930131 RepID=UPI001FB30852|nr:MULTISPECIES: NAD-dependent epimerase/dehydratase family protein [unclassified Staphylococcus]MCJ1655532.1 NAD-dependent epimerase/dehydratase family protein [Staphylococcus sp. NRL 21/187]MCJ1661362.1 NAD-dependent epimerase/dehydratase family protein [Staphylococcus sp. NRL 18/288]MCJ1667257.1 NAD-dependent epimerase/dehydratase family protein [Staphylococcus sp. NRL 19/737]WEN69741.1 NAD-dependent epimerase/dehydratase family protein [Staphylococcus sp. NRL 16/872]
MKVLITGGAGFIGSHVAQKFMNEHIDVHIIDNLSTGFLENIPFVKKENIYIKDITDYNFVTHLIKKEQFDYIIHLAAMVSVVETIEKPKLSNEVNIEATVNLLEATRKWNPNIKKLIFASSAAVYGNLPDLPKSVSDSKVFPLSPYAIQKFSGEQYAKIYNNLYQVPCACLRFFNIYGPRQNPNSDYSGVLSIMNSKFTHQSEFTFYGDGEQTRDFVYIDDLISALWLTVQSSETNGQIYNVGTGSQTNLKAVFSAFEKGFGYSIPYSFKAPRLGDIKHSCADITPLKALGYTPQYTIDEGIKAYLAYNNKNKITF